MFYWIKQTYPGSKTYYNWKKPHQQIHFMIILTRPTLREKNNGHNATI